MSEMRAVFDTNIFVSGIIFGGAPRMCLEAVRAGDAELCISRAILRELFYVLREKFAWTDADAREAVAAVFDTAKLVEPAERLRVIQKDDPDNRILEVAVAANADCIVSGDKRHILPLQRFRGIDIMSASAFLRHLSR